jgi:hypothetical protein
MPLEEEKIIIIKIKITLFYALTNPVAKLYLP